ncbi:MAG: hypothetical protein Q7U38_07235, partial [Methylobacter sp.]|nr:hypothetical protein [Methylobacter sp.]
MIDTQGLIASSLNLSDQDFLSGNYHFMAGPSAGNIVNEDIIRAGKDGNVILIAPQIENNGIISSDGGAITLAAGQELTITNLDDPNIRFQVQAPSNSVLNIGQLLTEGGAINVFAGTIKHSGDISADSVEVDAQGNIRLVAQQDITLEAGSTISANNSAGDAGAIHIDSTDGTTLAQGVIEAQASQTGKGGKIELLGERVGMLAQAQIDASGEKGGGEVLIGGDYQGKNTDVHNAKAAFIGRDAVIKADAKSAGDGGKVIVWSDDSTRVHGDISAKGGEQSGDGGFIETSGHWLDTASIRVNASAPNGKGGEWLIDPFDITIDAAGSTTGGTLPDFIAGSTGSFINNTDINTQLNSGTSVTIYTGGTDGTDEGNITVSASIEKTAGNDATLHLKADNAIIIDDASIISLPVANNLHVILNADADGNGAGGISINNSQIISNGGNIIMGGGVCDGNG